MHLKIGVNSDIQKVNKKKLKLKKLNKTNKNAISKSKADSAARQLLVSLLYAMQKVQSRCNKYLTTCEEMWAF